MDYEAFNSKLTTDAVGLCFLFTLLLISAIIMLFVVKRQFDDSKISRITMYILCVFLIIVCICNIVSISYETHYDISNHAYIEYEGKFYVDYFKSSGDNHITLYDENGTIVKYPAGRAESGEHEGRIIYAEKSRRAFVVEVD